MRPKKPREAKSDIRPDDWLTFVIGIAGQLLASADILNRLREAEIATGRFKFADGQRSVGTFSQWVIDYPPYSDIRKRLLPVAEILKLPDADIHALRAEWEEEIRNLGVRLHEQFGRASHDRIRRQIAGNMLEAGVELGESKAAIYAHIAQSLGLDGGERSVKRPLRENKSARGGVQDIDPRLLHHE